MSKHLLAVHRCRREILIALDHPRVGLEVSADPWPLSPIGEVEVLRQSRATFEVKGYGFKKRSALDIRRRPAGTVTVLAEHHCEHPTPPAWRQPPTPPTITPVEF
jgi:hypothetical protein